MKREKFSKAKGKEELQKEKGEGKPGKWMKLVKWINWKVKLMNEISKMDTSPAVIKQGRWPTRKWSYAKMCWRRARSYLIKMIFQGRVKCDACSESPKVVGKRVPQSNCCIEQRSLPHSRVCFWQPDEVVDMGPKRSWASGLCWAPGLESTHAVKG